MCLLQGSRLLLLLLVFFKHQSSGLFICRKCKISIPLFEYLLNDFKFLFYYEMPRTIKMFSQALKFT